MNLGMTNTMMPDLTRTVTGGVDTHKHIHVGAIIDGLGRLVDTAWFPATTAGYGELLGWMQAAGDLEMVGVEGTGSWGAGLSRHFTTAGVTVVEISRPDRRKRRLKGKSDTIDAVLAARAAAAGDHHGTPKTGHGPVEAIRVTLNARQSAVKAKTATSNQINAVIDTAQDNIRDQFRGLSGAAWAKKMFYYTTDSSDPDAATIAALEVLAQRWKFLHTQTTFLKNRLKKMVEQTAPSLCSAYCVGPISAARLLIAAGDNPHRLGSEAAFAALCGATPVPASSGQTVRVRLNRGGNRQANTALYTIAMSRLRHEPRTQTYMQRRTSEGKTKREIIRCLKRAIARETYPLIINDLTPNT
jgi:transposase